MDIIETIVSNLLVKILTNIANNKLPEHKREEFISKYSKKNYSKFSITTNSISIKRYNKYLKIYNAIIIQKYYRRYIAFKKYNKNLH